MWQAESASTNRDREQRPIEHLIPRGVDIIRFALQGAKRGQEKVIDLFLHGTIREVVSEAQLIPVVSTQPGDGAAIIIGFEIFIKIIIAIEAPFAAPGAGRKKGSFLGDGGEVLGGEGSCCLFDGLLRIKGLVRVQNAFSGLAADDGEG